MRHSKKKGDQTPLHEQDAMRSEDDFAPGGNDGSAQVDDPSFDASRGNAETGSGGEVASGASQGSATDTSSSDPAGERERYLRLAAEYDNYRKRSAKERQDAGARAQADLVRQLVEALDDVARFAHIDPATTDASTVVQGVDMVEKKLLKALGAAGLEVINPVGETFDPALHEAVATEPTSAREDDHVVARVYQPGYLFKSQLLRPARVVVKQWNG
jgi:molecular chaperone GrpE